MQFAHNSYIKYLQADAKESKETDALLGRPSQPLSESSPTDASHVWRLTEGEKSSQLFCLKYNTIRVCP